MYGLDVERTNSLLIQLIWQKHRKKVNSFIIRLFKVKLFWKYKAWNCWINLLIKSLRLIMIVSYDWGLLWIWNVAYMMAGLRLLAVILDWIPNCEHYLCLTCQCNFQRPWENKNRNPWWPICVTIMVFDIRTIILPPILCCRIALAYY